MSLTPNMNLPYSVVGVDSGLSWEQNLNAALGVSGGGIDSHNHTSGNGVAIPPSGLNINSNLSFQSNSATDLQAISFTPQVSFATLSSIYSIGADLYYNDANSNVIQITSGGSVNATSSGIVNGTATASFVASVLVVDASPTTPANIQVGSVLIGNNVASSKFLTLAPPAAMGSNFTLTLPNQPAQTNVMSLASNGTMSSITYDAVGQAMTSTGANAIANTRTRATGISVGVGGVARSASSSNFTTSSSTLTAITNLSVTITTSAGGRPVRVGLISDGSANQPLMGVFQSSGGVLEAIFAIYNGATQIARADVQTGSNVDRIFVPVSSLLTEDFPAANGTYTYTVKTSVIGGNQAWCQYATLIAYEI